MFGAIGTQERWASHLLRSDTVIPIVFAVLMPQFPCTTAQFSRLEWLQRLGQQILRGWPWGDLLYFILIILFSYFYTAAGLRA